MGRSATDVLAHHGIKLADDELAHYGKKGMRWGRRKKQDSSEEDSGPPKPSIKDMSDADLKAAINRLKMEREFATLTAPQVSEGRKIVKRILLDVGEQHAKAYLNKQVGELIGGGLKGALKTAAKGAVTEAAARPVMKLNPAHGLKL